MVFVIIMTVRQAVAILLSCMMYGHAITAYGVFGVTMVFAAMFFKIYYAQLLRTRKNKNLQKTSSSSTVLVAAVPGAKA